MPAGKEAYLVHAELLAWMGGVEIGAFELRRRLRGVEGDLERLFLTT